MKYWEELNELENALIDLDLIKSNFRVIANGIETSNHNDVYSAIEFATSSFENKFAEALDNFHYLFGIISKDTPKTDYVQPSEATLELDRIVRGWSKA